MRNRLRVLFQFSAIFGLLVASSRAQVCIDGVTTLTAATVEQARAVLGKVDGSLQEKSLWECGAQMGEVKEVDRETYAKYTADCALEWTPEERAGLIETFNALSGLLKPYAHLFPREVFIIKTDGREEYGGAYTRQNAVIIERPPAGAGGRRAGGARADGGTTLTGGGRGPRRGDAATTGTRGVGRRGGRGGGGVGVGLLAHELFHVLSRHNPGVRDRIYAALGFEFCGPLQWPAPLERTRIANPDAPINQHWIDVTLGGEPHKAMPVIYARTERYGIDVNGSLGQFMELRLLMVKKSPDGKGVVAEMKDGKPLESAATEVQGLYEKIGRNTNYIIHPEETAADNFAILVQGRPAQTPEIIEKIKAVLLTPAAPAAQR